jgi:hypothetical protein
LPAASRAATRTEYCVACARPPRVVEVLAVVKSIFAAPAGSAAVEAPKVSLPASVLMPAPPGSGSAMTPYCNESAAVVSSEAACQLIVILVLVMLEMVTPLAASVGAVSSTPPALSSGPPSGLSPSPGCWLPSGHDPFAWGAQDEPLLSDPDLQARAADRIRSDPMVLIRKGFPRSRYI